MQRITKNIIRKNTKLIRSHKYSITLNKEQDQLLDTYSTEHDTLYNLCIFLLFGLNLKICLIRGNQKYFYILFLKDFTIKFAIITRQ